MFGVVTKPQPDISCLGPFISVVKVAQTNIVQYYRKGKTELLSRMPVQLNVRTL